MKKLSFFMIIALIVAMLSVAIQLAEPASADNLDRYGYSLLTNDRQKLAYQKIAEGISALTADIKFSCDGITTEDVEFAGAMIVRDYPEFFWYDGSAGISITGKDVTFSPSGYKVNGQTVTAGSAALTDAKNQLEAAISKAVALLTANTSQYEIAHTFHDYVVNNVSYEAVGDHQSAYGALVAGKAICAGYARAFQLLMNRAGIRCWYVAGYSYDPEGTLVAHAWNLYWLNGKCYYSDSTWDDQGVELFHEYLNMSLEDISKTHFTEDTLPASCNHDDYTFFIMNDGKGVCDVRDHKNAKEVAKCFEIKSQNGENVTYYCTIHYHGDDFYGWIMQNIGTIVQELGFKGSPEIGIIELGNEHHVTVSGQVKQVSKPTDPTEPSSSTAATEPTPTTKPSEPAPTTKPTEPAPTTKPTEPAPTAKPTEPAPTEKPTDPSASTATSAPADSSEPSGTTGTQATDTPAGSSKPSATEGTKNPSNSPANTDGDSGSMVIIVALCAVGVVGIGAAVYFLVNKKK